MTPHHASRRGLSFIEVVISLAILITALAALIGNIVTLNMGHRSNQEVARVRDVVQTLVERIQGINWNDLNSNDESLSWTWSRRGPITASSPIPDPGTIGTEPPMTEEASTSSLATRVHNLLIYDPAVDDGDPSNNDEPVTGFIAEPTGLTNLRVWVEYRHMDALDSVASRSAWLDKLDDADVLMDPHNKDGGVDYAINTFDPTTFNKALVVRVVARWDSFAGGERHYEVSFSRRR